MPNMFTLLTVKISIHPAPLGRVDKWIFQPLCQIIIVQRYSEENMFE